MIHRARAMCGVEGDAVRGPWFRIGEFSGENSGCGWDDCMVQEPQTSTPFSPIWNQGSNTTPPSPTTFLANPSSLQHHQTIQNADPNVKNIRVLSRYLIHLHPDSPSTVPPPLQTVPLQKAKRMQRSRGEPVNRETMVAQGPSTDWLW